MRMPYFTINRFPRLKATKNNMVTINENNIKIKKLQCFSALKLAKFATFLTETKFISP